MPPLPPSLAARAAVLAAVAVLGAAVSVAALVVAGQARAEPAACAYDEPSRTALLVLPAGAVARLAVDAAGRIVTDAAGTPCAGATRTNTLLVRVVGQAGSAESLLVDLGDGPLTMAVAIPEVVAGPAADPVEPPVSSPAVALPVLVDLGPVDAAANADGAADQVTVRASAGDDRVEVSLADAVAGGAATSARIRASTFGHAALELELAHAAGVRLTLDAAGGDDRIDGSPLDELIDGGSGNDVLVGGGGADRYRFAPASDTELDTVVEPADGELDELDLAAVEQPVLVDLSAVGGTVAAHAGRSLTLAPGGRIEVVTTGDGNDRVRGSSAAEHVSTGAGDDDVDLRGTGPDSVSCGSGGDSVAVDADDVVADDCERPLAAVPAGAGPSTPVETSSPPPQVAGPVAAAPARPAVKALRRAPTVAIGGRSLRLARDDAVRVLVRCPSLARGTCRLALELSVRRPLILRDGGRLVHLGAARRTVAAGRTRSIAIGLTRRTARAVRSRGSVSVVLEVTARDASGRARTTRKPFALRVARH